MSAPFVWIFVCFSCGIICSQYLSFPEWILIPALLTAAYSLKIQNFRIGLAAQCLWIVLLAALFTQYKEDFYTQNSLRKWISSHEKEVTSFEGFLIRTPEISRDYFVLHVKIKSIGKMPAAGIARLTVSGELHSPLIAGDAIESYARFRLPKNFRAEGAFDYERHLLSEGIHALGTIKSARLIHKTGDNDSWRKYSSAIRLQWIQNTIDSFSERDAGVLRALWLDDRGGLNQDLQQILINAGVYHVIAISGFHISVLLLLLFFLMKRVISFRWAIGAACVLLLGYFLILEGRASVTRSFLSFVVLAFAIWKQEQIRLANWLFATAFLQLMLNPFELYDPGFHLTYLSTGAILFLVIPACKYISKIPRRYRYVLNFVITGALVQLVLIPYQIYVFHRIPIYGFIANVVAVPLSSVLIASSVVLLPLPFVTRFVLTPIRSMIYFFLSSAGICADEGVRIIPSPAFGVLIAFYCCLAVAIVVQNKSMKRIAFGLGALLLCLILFPVTPRPLGDMRIHFIDVGQGDSILLQYPDGTADLVDGGGFFNSDALDTGESVLLPYFCRVGIHRLQRVFLTHAHADHMNGLASLMKYIPISEFYVTRRPVGERGYQHFIRRINRSPMPVAVGREFQQAGVHLKVLAPEDSRKTMRVANDDSLVLLIQYKGKRILLTGDMELEEEENICRSAEIPGIDYIKVPHHGSKSSSSQLLLDTLRPRMAFISVGSNNWFGHPHDEILNRYRRHHVVIYRTDEYGTLVLRIADGKSEVDLLNF
jgi:competence protein ComEC